MSAGVQCFDCLRSLVVTREEARRLGWEPYSRRTQRGLDHGPMVCPSCVGAALGRLMATMREAARAGRF